MANELTLITGGTGLVGIAVIVEALKRGYRVRAAVRTIEGFQKIANVKVLQPSLDRLEYVLVPDITQDGAYDEAVKGTTYIIHVASPYGHPNIKDYDAELIEPAVKGTLGMLQSAMKEPRMKRIVITSSVVASISYPLLTSENGEKFTEETPLAPLTYGPYNDLFEAYCASKVASQRATTDFMKKTNPAFELTKINPSFVIGHNYLTTDTNIETWGSNALSMMPVLGLRCPFSVPGSTVHVDDVAMMHVRALEPEIPSNVTYFATSAGSTGTRWSDAIDIVARNFPNEVAGGVFPLGGDTPSLRINFDSSFAEETFQFKFKGYEEQVTSIAGQYLELIRSQS